MMQKLPINIKKDKSIRNIFENNRASKIKNIIYYMLEESPSEVSDFKERHPFAN